jgi:hypothetical protein
VTLALPPLPGAALVPAALLPPVAVVWALLAGVVAAPPPLPELATALEPGPVPAATRVPAELAVAPPEAADVGNTPPAIGELEPALGIAGGVLELQANTPHDAKMAAHTLQFER